MILVRILSIGLVAREVKNPQKTLATKQVVSSDSDTFVDMRCYLIESYVPRWTALRTVPLAMVTLTPL
jgi:hypothetical protein